MKQALIGICAVFGLASCATMKDNYSPTTKQISNPPLNTVTTVSLGEDMLKQGTAVTTKGVTLTEENKIGGFTLSPGFYPQAGEDADRVYASYETSNSIAGMGRIIGGGAFVDPKGLSFDKSKKKTCVIYTGLYGISQHLCDTEHGYQFNEMPIYTSNSFQQTLIYSGRIGNNVKVSYREFSGNMARGAFTNDAEYDLSTSDEIAYKGAKIKVISADNKEIKYIVISNFNVIQ